MEELENRLEDLQGQFDLALYNIRQLQQEIANVQCQIERAKELEPNLN